MFLFTQYLNKRGFDSAFFTIFFLCIRFTLFHSKQKRFPCQALFVCLSETSIRRIVLCRRNSVSIFDKQHVKLRNVCLNRILFVK